MESDSKRAILAVVLSGLILFGFNYFFPQQTYTAPEETAVKAENNNKDVKTKESDNTSSEATPVESRVVTLLNNELELTIDNKLNIIDAKSANSKVTLSENFENLSSKIKFKTNVDYESLDFVFEKVSDSKYILKSEKINGVIELDAKGFLSLEFTSANKFKTMFVMNSPRIEKDSTFFNQYVLLEESLDTFAVGSDDTGVVKSHWFGIDYNYHIGVFILDNMQDMAYKLTEKELNSDEVYGDFILKTANAADEISFKYIFAKKNYDDLIALENNLKLAVDFGIWSVIAVPILRGLQIFYDYFQNYGVAIIFLTIVIRTLTFPLQYKSFKSMKKMQVIQPELQAVREKYKSDPQKMQQETMALFKKAGANPLGGCLPMLLQMPIFFAFYKVLYSAVELVDAPFIFWIVDLSEKDPFYVLPVLMGLAMFLNMKLTPSTTSMDPAQQKVMMFMPLLFTLFMVNLPSGLTLYILISTIVGMLQQLFVYRRTN